MCGRLETLEYVKYQVGKEGCGGEEMRKGLDFEDFKGRG